MTSNIYYTITKELNFHYEIILLGDSQTQRGKTVSQKLQVQKMKLSFLRKCVKLKRPPPSLRVKGAPIVPDDSKQGHFSIFGALMLGEAIKNTINEERRLYTVCNLESRLTRH
jgi:hypothetical protein